MIIFDLVNFDMRYRKEKKMAYVLQIVADGVSGVEAHEMAMKEEVF